MCKCPVKHGIKIQYNHKINSYQIIQNVQNNNQLLKDGWMVRLGGCMTFLRRKLVSYYQVL